MRPCSRRRSLRPEHAALVASDRDEQRFDVLVVDEVTSVNLDALNEMLRGGLENGRWCFFLDGANKPKSKERWKTKRSAASPPWASASASR